MNREFSNYNTVILDIDGVVLDSNFLKETNIYIVTQQFSDNITAEAFAEYFTSLNGIPREQKIFGYFKDDIIANNILDAYNKINSQSLFDVSLTEGVLPFLQYAHKIQLPIVALSGGLETEVKDVLRHKKIDGYFHSILGGPSTKIENLKKIKIEAPVLYVGDSEVDFQVAKSINADFVFMYGYTQFKNWDIFFSTHKEVKVVKDFIEINTLTF